MTKPGTYSKDILCLANSRRPSGRCVAGKEVVNRKILEWIRPISGRIGHEINDRDRVYSDDSTYAEVLEVIRIHFLNPMPIGYQTENHVIDSDIYWEKLGRGKWKDVVAATDQSVSSLWVNGSSTYHGQNDKVPEAVALTLDSSLALIEPKDLRLYVGFESGYGGQAPTHRTRATFMFNGVPYSFIVTDPYIESLYGAKGDGAYEIDEARLCVSLAEVKYGLAMKLVASVITPDRCAL